MRITAICLLLWVSSALVWAGSVQGTVKDSQGHPVKGAEVRIESKNAKFSKTITTDAKGRYFCDGLGNGTGYKLTLIVSGSIKASILNPTVGEGKPNELNFNLRPEKGSPKKHLVWIPLETGTHIGSNGKWVEVDDNGRVVNDDPNLVRAGSEYAKHLQLSGARRPQPEGGN